MKTTVTERGQIPIPAQLRREMHLTPGRTVLWEKLSDHECRLTILSDKIIVPDPPAALGFAREHGSEEGSTEEWMKILREGEAN